MKRAHCKTLHSLFHAFSNGMSSLSHSVIGRAGRPGLIVLALISGITIAVGETDLSHPLFTWSLSPVDGQWENSANWSPVGVPDDQSERAAFGSSSITAVSVSFEEIHSVEFNSGASPFTITGSLVLNGGGVINNSGITQTFTGGFYYFEKGATVSGPVTWTNSSVGFARTEQSGIGCSAGTGTFINPLGMGFSTRSTAGQATILGNSATVRFDKADAGSATIVSNGGATFGAAGGLVKFRKSGAYLSTIILNGGAVFGGHGARCTFHKSAAGAATIIANGGAGPGSGATILFSEDTQGDTARIEVFGNGNFDMSRPKASPNTIGSLEGNGLVFLGAGSLSIGGNNLNTNFAGVISDEGGIQQGSGGSITKNGTGTLTFSSANTYTGTTTISSGSLLVNNTAGSGTGTGHIQNNSGTLGGTGIVAGSVTIGNGTSSAAILSPGASPGSIGLFTTQAALTFSSLATCQIEINSTSVSADEIVANGVTINSNAQFSFADLGSSTLSAGTSFTIINNTAATPISGTFANLADGATITIGSNNFQASYEGGGGNDLTLTVLP